MTFTGEGHGFEEVSSCVAPLAGAAMAASALGLGPSYLLEVRTSDLGVAAVADAYDKVLRSAGFTAKAGDEPSAAGRQTEYRNGDRKIAVLVLGRDDLAAPPLRPLADAVGSPAATVLLATNT